MLKADKYTNISLDSLSNLGFSDALLTKKVISDSNRVWRREPVDLKVFCEDEAFLGRPNGIVPSQAQYEIAFGILGGDPKKIPDPKKVFSLERKIKWGALIGGKGGGKDLITSIIFAYCLYILLCLENPMRYLTGFESEENIDLLNVSQAGKQSKRIFFDHLKRRIKGCKWFRDNYKIVESNRILDKDKINVDIDKILIGESQVICPHNIRLYAETSHFEAIEGYNTLLWCIDEADALPHQGAKVSSVEFFNAFTSSQKTRFGNRSFGMMISWPRGYVDSFMFQKYFEAEEGAKIGERYAYGFRYTTFDMLPPHYYSGESFEYTILIDRDSSDYDYFKEQGQINAEGYVTFAVPVELLPDNNSGVDGSEDFECKILCVPPPKAGAILRYPGEVEKCVIPDDEYVPLLDLSNNLFHIGVSGDKYLYYDVLGERPLSKELKSFPRAVFIDKSTHRDITCAMIGYAEPVIKRNTNRITGMTTVYPDFVLNIEQIFTWIPNRGDKIQVEVTNVDDIILRLADIVPIKGVYGDKWEPSSPQRFDLNGIPFTTSFVGYEKWRNFIESGIYAGRVKFPRHIQLIKDIKTVSQDGNRATHTDIGLVAAGLFNAIQANPEYLVVGSNRPSPSLAYRGGSTQEKKPTIPVKPGERKVTAKELLQTSKVMINKRPVPRMGRK